MIRASLISMAGISALVTPVVLIYSTDSAPKLVFSSRGGRNVTQLSWDLTSFFKTDGSIEEGKEVPFKESKLKFGNYQLKEGDILCSPDQDGNYFVMKKREGGNTGYSIEGTNQVWEKCPSEGFLRSNQNVKTVQFKGFKRPFGRERNLYSPSISLSSCIFTLQKSTISSKLEIIWDKCRSAEAGGTLLQKATMIMDN